MLLTGTSGWAYPSWKPDFYPPKLAAAKFLSYYASRLHSVEVNYTFRRLPTESLLRKWVAETPPEFRFAIKAHQSISHFRRLRNASEPCSRFLAAIKPLRAASRLAAVLVQLPPDLKRDADLLAAFLQDWPRDLCTAFEFRHDSWFDEAIYQLLRRYNVALCQAATEDLETPAVVTADFAYLRYRKDLYAEEDRRRLAIQVAAMLANGDTLVYFKHEDTPAGALWAEELARSASPPSAP